MTTTYTMRAVLVAVVRAFVIVPHGDHRQHLMQALAIGIGGLCFSKFVQSNGGYPCFQSGRDYRNLIGDCDQCQTHGSVVVTGYRRAGEYSESWSIPRCKRLGDRSSRNFISGIPPT